MTTIIRNSPSAPTVEPDIAEPVTPDSPSTRPAEPAREPAPIPQQRPGGPYKEPGTESTPYTPPPPFCPCPTRDTLNEFGDAALPADCRDLVDLDSSEDA